MYRDAEVQIKINEDAQSPVTYRDVLVKALTIDTKLAGAYRDVETQTDVGTAENEEPTKVTPEAVTPVVPPALAVADAPADALETAPEAEAPADPLPSTVATVVPEPNVDSKSDVTKVRAPTPVPTTRAYKPTRRGCRGGVLSKEKRKAELAESSTSGTVPTDTPESVEPPPVSTTSVTPRESVPEPTYPTLATPSNTSEIAKPPAASTTSVTPKESVPEPTYPTLAPLSPVETKCCSTWPQWKPPLRSPCQACLVLTQSIQPHHGMPTVAHPLSPTARLREGQVKSPQLAR